MLLFHSEISYFRVLSSNVYRDVPSTGHPKYFVPNLLCCSVGLRPRPLISAAAFRCLRAAAAAASCLRRRPSPGPPPLPPPTPWRAAVASGLARTEMWSKPPVHGSNFERHDAVTHWRPPLFLDSHGPSPIYPLFVTIGFTAICQLMRSGHRWWWLPKAETAAVSAVRHFKSRESGMLSYPLQFLVSYA